MTNDNTATVRGPAIDSNPVFDSVFTTEKPKKLSLTVTKVVVENETNNRVGDTFSADFLLKFPDWVDSVDEVTPPYDLYLSMTNPSSRTSTTLVTQKYPITYEPWVWGTSCENNQFGPDNEVDATKPPKLSPTKQTCSVTSTSSVTTLKLSFTAAAAKLTSKTWSNFKLSFRLKVTNPGNHIGKTTNVDAWLKYPTSD